MSWFKERGCHAHSNANIWSELVVCVTIARPINIFVDTSAVDVLFEDIMVIILGFVFRNPIAPLKAILYHYGPFLKRNYRFLCYISENLISLTSCYAIARCRNLRFRFLNYLFHSSCNRYS